MKTLTIEIPKGFEARLEDGVVRLTNTSTKKKSGNVIDRILTIADVLEDHDIPEDQFEKECKGLTADERAYRLIKLLAKSLNEGWEPNWSDSSEPKYYPWFEMRGASGFRFDDCGAWLSYSHVGSRLCYKTRELAEHAGRNFQGVYEDFMVIK